MEDQINPGRHSAFVNMPAYLIDINTGREKAKKCHTWYNDHRQNGLEYVREEKRLN